MRKRSQGSMHGWLIVDKPAGITSAAVVGAVRRLTKASKAGHGGTLDPMATGVLPVALGEATKTVAYVVEGLKTYRFTVRWGEQRDTDDADGVVIRESAYRPSVEEIEAALPHFTGDIQQVPPRFSAVKIAGQRAYALARAEQTVDLPARPARIEAFRLVAKPDADHAVFEVVSGKGVYMRSLARDLAIALGTCGHVKDLRRLAVGPFAEAAAISLEQLKARCEAGDLQGCLLSVGVALAGMPALSLTEAEARRLQHGRPIAVLPVATRSALRTIDRDGVFCAVAWGRPVALAKVHGGEIRPLRILNL